MMKELEYRLKGTQPKDDNPSFDAIYKQFAMRVADTKDKHQNFIDLTQTYRKSKGA